MEHLEFFALLKGMPSKLRRTRTQQVVEDVGLTEKKGVFSRNLSG